MGLEPVPRAATRGVSAMQARADNEQSSYLTLVRLPTCQYVTPTAMRGAVQQFLPPGPGRLPELCRRRGGALAAQPRRHDAGDHLRRPELALQAGRYGR